MPADRSLHQSNRKRGKTTPDAVASFSPDDVVHLVGLAHCRFCRKPLFFNGYKHWNSPTWGTVCDVLRSRRCIKSYNLFILHCNKEGSEQW